MAAVTPLRLSVLDQSPIPDGLTAVDALHNTLDLARLADQLGYFRYWVAEHHATPALACLSPEVLIGPIAQSTRRLRIGSGGIMLPHYSPLKVAENFSMLGSLFPGRIDLGIGRAAGTSPAVAFALQRDRRQAAPDDFPEQLEELLGCFGAGQLADHTAHGLATAVRPATPPEIWLLGSSPQSAIWAAELGLPYCFADFINPQGAVLTRQYALAFTPSPAHPAAQPAVAAWVVCADTDEEAEELSLSARMMLSFLHRGRLIAVPTVNAARRFFEQDKSALPILSAARRFITGSPATVRQAIEDLAEEYGAQEVLLVNILHDHQARRRSYELVAREFELKAAGVMDEAPYAITT